MFETIEKEHEGDYIVLRGINASTLISDVARIYKFNINMEEPNKAKLFFNIIISGVIFKKMNIKFHRFFALDIYFIMDKLWDITQRSMYKQACDLLMEEPNVKKYYTPLLELPSEISNRLNDINIKLFPYQQQFLSTYYNAIHKLELEGYILALGMGLGKTACSIALCYAFNLIPCIITGPRSVIPGWKDSILKFIPSMKQKQVQLITEYNPAKEKTKWKFLICNYEKLETAAEYSKYAAGPIQMLIIDESQNFRNLTTARTQTLLRVKQDLNIKNILALSGSPIKSLSSELIPMLKLLDPLFDDEATAIFKRVYSRSSYDPITASVIKNKLSTYLDYKETADYVKLPEREYYNVNVKLADPKPYYVSTMKDNVWKYVNENMPTYRAAAKPNLDKLEELLKNNIIQENFSKEDINDYWEAVKGKYRDPFNKDYSLAINTFENEKLKPLNSALYKEVLTTRRKITSYMAILIGKAIGIYFVHAKIELMVKMVQENVNAIADIINKCETKTIIFSTFAAPLFAIKEELEKAGIGCIIHTGNSDVVETKDRFKNDNSVKALLATVGSIGTGVDMLQYIASEIIYINRSYRASDEAQQIARIWRRGQAAKVVKIFYLKLDTGDEPNILDSESEISDWSRQMFRIAISS